ncbi:hypothetical protein PB01_05235 [Psychrobacillus glaciei]|uniref:DUF2642 domain-containing protein n=1 Tax=Psychrobacillus glaciei TaxID=2283160 RepID=A0A5J6SKM5_9BACI|nr:hypothetical protein [Psychrobacillus glaciei]QFF98269.1 hypothetical protein PB01_05235 [Psychrobacillus glaciei]
MLVENLKKVLYEHKKMKIGMYLSDNQFTEGILLDVKQDHLVMEVNKKIVYFAMHSIQALSINAKDFCKTDKLCSYLDKNDLTDVLIALRYNWVTINSLSKFALNGVLTSILHDHIVLINKKELLYIPKPYISNIYSELTRADMTYLNNKEQLILQELYKSNISKGLVEIKEPNLESNQEKVNQEYCIFEHEKLTEQSNLDKMGEIKAYPLEKLDEDDFIEKRNNFESANSSQITVMPLESNQNPNSIKDLILLERNEETTEQQNYSKEMETEYLQQDELTIVNNLEITISNEVENNVGSLILEGPNEIIQEVGNGKNKRLKLYPKSKIKIKSNLLQQNSLEQVEKSIIKIDNVENSKILKGDPLTRTNTPLKQNHKKTLLTAWSALNSDQSTITIPKKSKTKSKHLNSNRMSDSLEIQTELVHTLSPKSNITDKRINKAAFEAMDEKNILAEKKNFLKLAKPLSPKEEKALLEKQYFALMNYAAKKVQKSIRLEQQPELSNSLNNNRELSEQSKLLETSTMRRSINQKVEDELMEKQYYSLMKHAAKMYHQVRDHQ